MPQADNPEPTPPPKQKEPFLTKEPPIKTDPTNNTILKKENQT